MQDNNKIKEVRELSRDLQRMKKDHRDYTGHLTKPSSREKSNKERTKSNKERIKSPKLPK